ncbi:MAG: Gfo/Idh/MocA family oxidoreductase [Clostridia bacterium]|nr:Gfo/Idh/MocA family oxidoreductase [Clostridia bacterium]
MNEKVRWGIVGAGNIAHRFANAVKNAEGAELVAIASRSDEKGSKFAKEHGIEHVYVGYEELAKSVLVDAVYIATPHPQHVSCAKLFLNAKKHVLCEKPICVNAKEAIELSECAKKNGVFLMEAMWTRFLPAIIEAQAMINRGEIGTIKNIQADFCYHYPFDITSRVYNPELAGGGLLDVGVYCLHFASIFLGDYPEKIVAVGEVQDGIDHQVNYILQYKDGSIANLSSAVTVEKPATGYIYGTDGYIEIPNFFGANQLILHKNGETSHIEKPYMGNGFEDEITEVCNCIRLGKLQSDVIPLSKSIKMMEQIDEIRRQIGLQYPFETL